MSNYYRAYAANHHRDRPAPAGLTGGAVREAMAARCGWLPQGLLSRLTGRALPGQALRSRGRAEALCVAAAWTLLGLALGTVAAAAGGAAYWLLPVFWACTVHGARTLQVQMIHQAAHGTLIGPRRGPLNDAVGRWLSAALLVEEFSAYRVAHLHLHHPPAWLSTAADPTVLYLLRLGIEPGRRRAALWLRLLASLASPLYHARRAAERVGSHFRGTSPAYRVVVVAYLLALTAGAWSLGMGPAVVLAWLVPLFPLYESAAALRLCVEHDWPSSGPADAKEATHGIFCGCTPPPEGMRPARKLAAWAWWWAAMAGHAACRWLVLVGDTPCHDYHHDHPQSLNWPNEVELRQHDCDRRAALGLPNRTELWGLVRAIDRQFRLLSCLPLMTSPSNKE